jgi:hypothetical protein
MRQRLLQHLSLAKPLRLALVLSTLLLTLPQTAWGEEITKTITFNKTVNTVNSGINNSTMSVSINEQITGVASPSYDGEITILDNINGINSYSCSANGAVFKMNGSSTNSTFSLKIPGNYPAKPSKVIVKAAYANGALDSNSLYYFKIGVDDEYGDTYHYKLTTGPSNDNVEAEFTADGSPRTNRNSEGPLIVDFVIKAIDTQSENDRTTITVKEISITYTREVYGITVAGTSVKSDNATDVLGDGKVSYNATTKTLKLDGANINYTSGDAITASTTDPLNVNVVGANSISCGDHKAFNTSGNLVFQTSSGVASGQLTITSTSNIDSQSYYTCGGSVTYEDGLTARNLTSSSVLISTNYGITVAGTDVNSANATAGISIGNGNVYYDVSNNILTLDGANIDGMIKTELESLTINLKGANTISTTSSNFNNGIYSDKNTGTLTFTKEGANASLTIASNVSVIRGFASLDLENSGLYTNTSTPYKIKSDSSYPRLADATTSDADTTAIKSITISDVATYQLWVAGNQVTGAANVTGTGIAGTVSFNASNSILTLNAATITGTVESSLGDLTIHLTGVNTIKAPASPTSTITSLINSTNAGTLTFETDATTGNRLDFQQSDGSSFSAIPINGFTVAYEAGLGYYSSQIKETLFIEYNNNRYKLHSSNANDIVGDGKVSFSYDSTNGNVLTLNNANIEFIEMLIENDLTIALNGTCTIFNTGHTNAINSWGNLKFVKASGATSAELSASTIYYAPIASTGLTLGSGLYLKPISDVSTTITDDPNFVIIEDYAMDDSKTINGTTGTITYNSTDKVLTINGFQKDFGAKHAIKTGVKDLKVKLIGESTINCAADSAIFHAFCNSASIQFVKNDDTSKLTMTGTAFDKFAADNITYNGLVYYSANKYIAIPIAPTMDVNIDNKVVLTADYSGGTIAYKYSIDYADETADVTDATYSAPFEMAAPGTVTAWVEANGTTTSTVKGKKFGYQGAPFSMMVNDVKTPVLIPAIEAGDDIVYDSSTPYASNDASVATFENGNITAHAIGTATLTTRLGYNTNNVPTTKLLNYDGQFTTQLTVSKVFNIAFAEGANYMTYYNIDAEDLTIPDGMTAAIVTGVASSGTTVETTALSYIPGRTAILLGKGTSTGTPTITLFTGTLENTTANKLKYVDNNPVTTTGYEYVLYKDEFVKATGSIPDGKCYLDLTGAAPAPAPARSLGIDSDGTTDIRELRMENEERDEWYDLQGRRIEQPTKAGLYIKNGKKVIVNTK